MADLFFARRLSLAIRAIKSRYESERFTSECSNYQPHPRCIIEPNEGARATNRTEGVANDTADLLLSWRNLAKFFDERFASVDRTSFETRMRNQKNAPSYSPAQFPLFRFRRVFNLLRSFRIDDRQRGRLFIQVDSRHLTTDFSARNFLQ